MTDASPIHPGEHLADILEDLGVSQRRLAKAIAFRPSALAKSFAGGGRSRRTRPSASAKPCA